jgi:hypothetical protein
VETVDQHVTRQRLSITIVVLLAAMAHLAWEFFHGGVQTHHVLQRRDLPGISNWWGLLVLPTLAWFLVGRIESRVAAASRSIFDRAVVIGAIGAIVFGVLLSTAFSFRQEDVAFYVLVSILLMAIVLPVYRAECVLGFVLGMTFIFGALLPTAIASVIALISASLHLLLYPLLGRAWRAIRGRRSP